MEKGVSRSRNNFAGQRSNGDQLRTSGGKGSANIGAFEGDLREFFLLRAVHSGQRVMLPLRLAPENRGAWRCHFFSGPQTFAARMSHLARDAEKHILGNGSSGSRAKSGCRFCGVNRAEPRSCKCQHGVKGILFSRFRYKGGFRRRIGVNRRFRLSVLQRTSDIPERRWRRTIWRSDVLSGSC